MNDQNELGRLAEGVSGSGTLRRLEDRISDVGIINPSESFGNPPFEFGSIIYKPFFPTDDLELHQVNLVDKADRLNKSMHIGDSRDFGGPYEAHTDDMARLYVRECRKLGIKPDYMTIATIILHDFFEEHPDLHSLSKAYKKLKEKEKAKGMQYESEGSLELKGRIREMRLALGRQSSARAREVIDEIGLSFTLGQEEKEKMVQDVMFSLITADWLTRHTEERYFRGSMALLFKIHAGEDANKVLTPFQIETMMGMGIDPMKGGPLRGFTHRSLLKVYDRIVLSRERRARFESGEARELDGILRRDPVLQKVYGNVSFRAKEIPVAYGLNLLYRDFVVLHFLNISLSNYGSRIYQEREKDPVAYQHLRLIDRARKMLLSETGSMVRGLRVHYESTLGRKNARRIREAIEARVRKEPNLARDMTGEGPISRGISLDAYSRNDWADIERDWEANYRDAILFGFLRRNFTKTGNGNEVRYLNSGPVSFNLFHIGGLHGDTYVPPRVIP
jgi:hypothetical protein